MRAKKFLSLLMSLAMILTALPLAGFTAFAEDGTHTSGDFEYVVLKDGTAEITKYNGNAEILDIPSKLNGYTVTSIGKQAFANCDFTSITIPDSVTSIGELSFFDCESLTGITIGNSVTSIGVRAFENCNSLTSVTIPDSVTSIGESAFQYCDSLTSITIGNGVTSIGDLAFENCHSITSITIPDSVTSIGDDTFEFCESLTSVAIGNGVISIGDWAFYGCEGLTSIAIPDSVTNIGVWAFGECSNLTEIRVNANNKNYTSQDGVLFNKDKTELIQYPIGNERKTYDIPNSVTSIGGGAFQDCENLTDIYILNRECLIYNGYYTIPDKTTIHGYAGSAAEEYAKEYDKKFVAIDGEPVTPDPDKQNAIGDIDGNANITITDAKWILQNTVKSRNLTEAQAKAADLNKDGKVTIVDAKWVLQIVVGLRDAKTLKPIKK